MFSSRVKYNQFIKFCGIISKSSDFLEECAKAGKTSLTPDEQKKLRKLVKDQTIVSKNKGFLVSLGKSTNLSEGLFFAYGKQVREYFYNLKNQIDEFINETDKLKHIVNQLNAIKPVSTTLKIEKSITSLKVLFGEMNSCYSHLIYYKRKDFDKSFQNLQALLKRRTEWQALPEILKIELAPISDAEENIVQDDALQIQLSTQFEELKNSISELYSIFLEEGALNSNRAIPETVLKKLGECLEKAINHNKLLARIEKVKAQNNKKYVEQMNKKAAIISKERELQAEINKIKFSIAKVAIFANTVKELNNNAKGYPKTIREDTKKSIDNSILVLEGCIEIAENLIRELNSFSIEESQNNHEPEEEDE